MTVAKFLFSSVAIGRFSFPIFRRLSPFLCVGICAVATLAYGDYRNIPVLTFHNDNTRAGLNTNEVILTPANVNSSNFTKVFSCAVDGYVYAQPLIMTNVAIPGKGVHNVLYVVTEHDSAYAFDADNHLGANASPLWFANFTYTNAAAGITNSTLPIADTTSPSKLSGATNGFAPEIGITSTPVIDPVTGTIYVVARTKDVTNSVIKYSWRLHALDITTGAEKFGGPVLIDGSVPGNGDGNVGGVLTFSLTPVTNSLSRAALLLNNGVVYIAFASLGDTKPYHGWVFGYDAQTLAQTAIFNANPNGDDAGIWQSGCGPAADPDGHIYVATGNGAFDPTTNNYGDSLLKLSTTNGLMLADYFTPAYQVYLNSKDLDFGSGGMIVLPDEVGSAAHPHLLTTADKAGAVYLIDRDNLTQYNPSGDLVVQVLGTNINKSWGSPAYFNHTVYYAGTSTNMKAFSLDDATFGPPVLTTNVIGARGGSPCVSANGTNNGIVWLIDPKNFASNAPANMSILYAYNATNVAMGLYNSAVAGQTPGPAIKFTVPTIANGKVYVGTVTNVAVYGLKSPIITNQPQALVVSVGSNATFSVSVTSLATPGYQWRKDGVDLNGATNATLAITDVQPTNGGLYSVVVTDAIGAAISVDVALSVPTLTTNTGQGTLTGSYSSSGSVLFFNNAIAATVYQLQASTDLFNWDVIATNPAIDDGLILFTDLMATNFNIRMYRLTK